MMKPAGQIELKSALSPKELAVEACIGLGARWQIEDRLIPALTAGHLVLLSILESPFLGMGKQCVPNWRTTAEAVTIFCEGPALVPLLFAREVGAGRVAWLEYVNEHAGIDAKIWPAVAHEITASIQYALGGFEMIRWDKSRQGHPVSDRFDLAWLAHYVAGVTNACPSATWDEIVWYWPMARTAHLAAATAGKSGAKVRRPIDMAAAFAALRGGQK